jgi:predicted small metal-binding protein
VIISIIISSTIFSSVNITNFAAYFWLSQIIEDCALLFCVRCADVGLDCDCTVFGSSEKKTMDKAMTHMFEHHAINPEEMTTCMRLKIKENILMD